MDSAKIIRGRQQQPAVTSVNSDGKATKGYPAITRFAQAPAGSSGNGLPHQLRQGVEKLSGMPMGDTSVHYNSSAPAQIGALAYAAGNQIHLGPGQEQHLPHEAWHIVQQKQGRVKPTLQAKGLAVNDDHVLETEADVMGQRAVQLQKNTNLPLTPLNNPGLQTGDVVQRKIGFEFQAYNSILINGVGNVQNPLNLPEGKGFTVETDVGEKMNELEIETDAVDETNEGLLRLTHIMRNITRFLQEVKHGTELRKMDMKWKDEVSEDAHFSIISGDQKHFHPQATVGVKFEKIAELIDYVTRAPFKEGGEIKRTIKRKIKKTPTSETKDPEKDEYEEAVVSVAEVKDDLPKFAEASKFGWSGKDDQQAFKYAWRAGFEKANADSKITSAKAKGLAAILYGLAEAQRDTSGIYSSEANLVKYWMPFMLRNGFRPFFDSLDEKQREELKNIDEDALNILIMSEGGDLGYELKVGDILKDMQERAGKPGDDKRDLIQRFDGVGVLGHGVIGGIPRHGEEERSDYKSWGMEEIDDIGISQTETERRRGAIIELRKLGNDVPVEKLEEFALAVFNLVKLINAGDGPVPLPVETVTAIGGTATGPVTVTGAAPVIGPPPPIQRLPRSAQTALRNYVPPGI
ncbi:DUF4157 domain-containing protein [Mucilaginibacter angelicae]|uniref:DUF4157 domain-containing protein n=1 Tax=Mucilaginibacter angelicae TaxID=869718 RepID=A0ABV6LF25_9SPHI